MAGATDTRDWRYPRCVVESAAASATSATGWRRLAGSAERVALAVVAAMLTVGATIVAIVLAAKRPLSVDEADIVAAVDDGFRSSLGAALEQEPGQTVYRALMHPLAAAGAPECALRAPSIVAVLAAAALVLHVGRLLGGRRAGIVAATLLVLGATAAGIAFHARPHALAVLGVALTTALCTEALPRRSIVLWVSWAVVAAPLPLLHPACGAAVVAQLAAVAIGRHGLSRVALPAAATVGMVAGLLVAAAAVERSGATASGDESTGAFATAVAHAGAWSPVALAAAVAGVVVLARRGDRWQATLLAGLAAGPLLALGVAALAFPVHPAAAGAIALPGVALAAGCGIAAIGDRRYAAGATAAALAAPVAALVVVSATGPPADWRRAARFVESRRGAAETVVVLPPRAAPAYSHYAPDARLAAIGRGDGVWVVLRTPWAGAVDAARDVVTTPRYALLAEQSFGDDLVVQHWVRP